MNFTLRPDTLLDRAETFALGMHMGQTWGGKKLPTAAHLEEVAGLVRQANGTEEEEAAAWLHEVVEKTGTTITHLERLFGRRVADTVDALTDPKSFEELPLSLRKQGQATHIYTRDRGVKKIKLADEVSMVRLMVVDPPGDWDLATIRDYIYGADLVAKVCSGVSEFLDEEFRKAYEHAMRLYTVPAH